MSVPIQIISLILLLFVLLPVISISIIIAVKFIYGKIRGHKTISTPKFIVSLLVGVICLALLPPIPYVISESYYEYGNVAATGNTAAIKYDKEYDSNGIRYIIYNGTTYKELIPSMDNTISYSYSDVMNFKYGEPLANILSKDQSLLEKYVYKVFNYPVNSGVIYPITNDGYEGYISLDLSEVFVSLDNIDERVSYYNDFANYNYYVEDYNTQEISDITLDYKVADEISKIYLEGLDFDYEEIDKFSLELTKHKEDADYDIMSLNGESKDGLLLMPVGELYEKDGKFYHIIYEHYDDDGSVLLYTVKLSDDATAKLNKALDGITFE